MKLIKAIHTKRYELELLEIGNNYIIAHSSLLFDEPQLSENITDFKTATFLFDLKLSELEGQ